jgi:acetyl-CoA synthetase
MSGSQSGTDGEAVSKIDKHIQELLDRYTDPKACLARLLCDDHPADKVAFTVVQSDLRTDDLTFGELRERSERVAAGLSELGVVPGDSVAVLMGKSAELVVALLGIWRCGAVHVPLFTAFAPPAIAMRLHGSDAKVVIVDSDQRNKLDPSEDLPADGPWRVVTVGGSGRQGDLMFSDLVESTAPKVAGVVAGPDAPFIMIFTSGTTGTPKGVPVAVRGLAHMQMYMEYGFDIRDSAVYWNAADPGWAYGLFYGIVGPLAGGWRNILLQDTFAPDTAWRVMSELGVTNYAAAPTVYRALRNATAPQGVRLRCASSAGEPLTPDLIPWAEQTFGAPIRDHYGQTELGMVIANGWHPDVLAPLKPGSMGRPLPGHNIALLLESADVVAPEGTFGRVAVDRTAPLFMFAGYHDAPAKTAQRYTADGRWYLTGDTAMRDRDGRYFFSSRDDDVIIMAGYRIGPFDVESVLVAHPDIAEAAVVGVPDDLRGEVIEAFVVPRTGVAGSDELTATLQQHVKTKFAAHAYPRAVHYVDALPKTPSGKIQRFLLRKQRAAELTATS